MTEKLRKYLKNFDLSKTEIEIVIMTYEGYSLFQIADNRFVSYKTIKSHMTKIYKKLKCKNRIQIYNLCLRYILPQLFIEKAKSEPEFHALAKQLKLPIGIG